jgi:hypothetical protein
VRGCEGVDISSVEPGMEDVQAATKKTVKKTSIPDGIFSKIIFLITIAPPVN